MSVISHCSTVSPKPLRWDIADAEIKVPVKCDAEVKVPCFENPEIYVPSFENPELAAECFPLKDIPLVEFMYLVFTRIPGESYLKRLWSLVLYLCYVFRALINSLVC